MKLNDKEAPIQAAVIKLLHLRGWRAFRVNSGKIRGRDGYWITLAPKGTSDVIAIVPGSGRLMAIECKRPGDADKATPEQLQFLAAIASDGGVAVVIDDPAVLDNILFALADDPHARFTLEGGRLT